MTDCWPVSEHGRCPNCGQFTGNRIAHVDGLERGWITATCKRCGPVKLEVVGWVDAEGNFG